MRKRGFLIGAVAGVLGALSLSSVASAVPTSQTLQATLSPAKQSKKTFGGASLHNIIDTTFDNFPTSQSPRQTVFTIDPNIKFTNGNVPACQLSQIQGKFTAQAQAACPQSIVGNGIVQVNGGAVGGTVTIFGGGPTTMYIQTDIGPSATSLTVVGTLSGRTLTFSNIPNTPGLVLSKFDHVQQAQDRQEEGIGDVLRDGALQEEEVGQLGVHELLQRADAVGELVAEVQAEEAEEEEEE